MKTEQKWDDVKADLQRMQSEVDELIERTDFNVGELKEESAVFSHTLMSAYKRLQSVSESYQLAINRIDKIKEKESGDSSL